MNKATRDDEKKSSGTRPESDIRFKRLVGKLCENPKLPREVYTKTEPENNSKVVHKSKHAINKDLSATRSKWLSQRGKGKFHNSHIAKRIFMMLDPQGSGEVEANDFCNFLIDIGIPVRLSAIKSVVGKVIGSSQIKNKLITEDEIAYLCRGDQKTTQTLTILNSAVLNHFDAKDKIVTSADHGNLLKRWWESLDSSRNNQVEVPKICEFLVNIKVFRDFFEARKFVDKVTSESTFIDCNQFYSLFAKPLIKHCLLNINSKFTEDDWNNSMYSDAYKLSQLKRKLILAGIQYPIPNISIEEGELALKAMSSLTKINKKPQSANYDEFKDNWFKLTGFKVESRPKAQARMHSSESEIELAIYVPKSLKPDFKKLQHQLSVKQKKVTIKQTEEIAKILEQKKVLEYSLFNDHFYTYSSDIKPAKKRFKTFNPDYLKFEGQNETFEDFQKLVNQIKY